MEVAGNDFFKLRQAQDANLYEALMFLMATRELQEYENRLTEQK